MIHETVKRALQEQVAEKERLLADAQHQLDSAKHLLSYAESLNCACGLPGTSGMVHGPEVCVTPEDENRQRARIGLAQLVQPAEAAAPGAIPQITGGAFGNPYPGTGPTPTTVMPQTGDTLGDPPTRFDSWPDLDEDAQKALERFTGEHAALCGDDTGPRKADTCVLAKGHAGDHRDDQYTWRSTTEGTDAR